jgi:mRNA interferase RelE/StbE
MKPVVYHTAALKSLRKMPVNTARRIVAKIDAYAADPASQANNVKALKGTDAIRLGVGERRVVVIDADVIDVIGIAPCGSVYRERKMP